MKLHLEVSLDNDAMQDVVEVKNAIEASILGATNATSRGPFVVGDAAVVIDFNGNTVGRWYVDAD